VEPRKFKQFMEQAARLSRRQRGDRHAHGLQRYRCVDCARSFNALTGTPLARLRHRPK
jgi:transposase-like protein